MSYNNVLELLKKQLEQIKTSEEYKNLYKNKALQTKIIALELEINVRSVRKAIKKLLEDNKIIVITGDKDKTEKYYTIKFERLEEWNKKQ